MTYHEKGVICSCADHTDFDPVFRIPLAQMLWYRTAGMSNKGLPLHSHQRRIRSRAYSKIIDSAFTIDFECVCAKG